MTASIPTSVRLSRSFEAELRSQSGNRASIALALMLIGFADVQAELGLDLESVADDVHRTLQFHLPAVVRARLTLLQQQLGPVETGLIRLGRAMQSTSSGRADASLSMAGHGTDVSDVQEESASGEEELLRTPTPVMDPLAGAGEDY